MERKVKWSRPEADKFEHLIYRSKCGRYTIQKRFFCGNRNGTFNVVGYSFATTANPEKTTVCETLLEAKEWAEMDNNPDWEP